MIRWLVIGAGHAGRCHIAAIQRTENAALAGVVDPVKAQIDFGSLHPRSIAFTGNIAPLTGWHTDPVRSGGGILRTIGLRYLDLCSWWLGPVRIDKAVLSGSPVEDTIAVNGVVSGQYPFELRIDATGKPPPGPMRCEIEADEGSLVMRGHEIISCEGIPKPPDVEPVDPDFPFGPGHLTVIAEASTSLQQNKAFPVPLDEFIPLLETVQAQLD